MKRKPEPVTLLPLPVFILEMRSERFVEFAMALKEAGFVVDQHIAHPARFIIDDAESKK